MKRLAILGSTGTIGLKALDVVRRHKDKVSVSLIVANRSWKKIMEQLEEFKPERAILTDYDSFIQLKNSIVKSETKINFGMDALKEALYIHKNDVILSAFSGTAGILPTYWAVENGSFVALANKESLVSAGDLIKKKASESKTTIVPVDSEHSALFQLLSGKTKEELKKIILPASGGPFLNLPVNEMKNITAKDALNHPVWNMGKKISIDSATLANKGLEVIEAHHLFDISFDKISVVIHPQCLIHGIIEMVDGAFFAHIGEPDMRYPITYAIFYPERCTQKSVDFYQLIKIINIFEVDYDRFPMLRLAYDVGKAGKSYPAAYNIADELAVNAFLKGEITFDEIYKIVSQTVEKHVPFEVNDIGFIKDIENETTNFVKNLIKKRKV